MRLIDADKLKKKAFGKRGGLINTRDIDDARTVAAVPVIRCMDCIYVQCNVKPDGALPKGVDEYECRHWCGACDPMDFCSYGEWKDGDGK